MGTESNGPTLTTDDTRMLDGSVEAILMAADRALAPAKIAEAISDAGTPAEPAVVRNAVERLNEGYEQSDRSFRIEHVAGGYRVMTLSEYAAAVATFASQRSQSKLSRAALETLAIVAYKQPITRARLEAIRGVGAGEVLRTLLDRRLVTITGRAEELGRPMLYGTTKQFLDTFGLSSIKDLPAPEELR